MPPRAFLLVILFLTVPAAWGEATEPEYPGSKAKAHTYRKKDPGNLRNKAKYKPRYKAKYKPRRFDRGKAYLSLFGGVMDDFLLVTVDRLRLTSTSALFSIKGIYPISRFAPFVAAGFGLNHSELELKGTLLGMIPGTIEKENDLTFTYQLALGADIAVSRRADIGFELQDINARADFGDLSGGRVEIGGRAFLLTVRIRGGWGR